MIVYTNEFISWQNDAPVVAISGNVDFEMWQLDAPVIDFDESNPSGQPRRRVQIY